MAGRKVQALSSKGISSELYHQKVDIWSKLRGDGDFKKIDSKKMWNLVSECLAEVLGTAVLVGLGCGGLLTGFPGNQSNVSHLNTVLTFACALSVVITVFGHISGAHVNPAISLSAVIFGYMSLPKFVLYSVSQCFGACLGIAAVKLISPDSCTANNFCMTLPSEHVSPEKAMMAEAMLTAILVWVIDAAWDRRCQDKNDSLPIKFALTIIALALPGAKYAGGSLNPARSFGPALIAGNWTKHWIYWIGPLGGSIVASAMYKTFFSEVDPPHPVRSRSVNQEEEQCFR